MDSSTPPPSGLCGEGLPCSFSQFLVSIGSSALVHLGELADPGTGRKERDLPVALHSIKVLELLRTKTKGNLEDGEAKLLDALIGDLSQKYEAGRAAPTTAG
jgi:hypothetical protein